MASPSSTLAVVNSRLPTWLVIVGGLAAAGAVLRPVEMPLWSEMRAAQPVLRLDSRVTAAGQGVMLGVLGGFRTLAADLVWIDVHENCVARDLPSTEALLQLVTVIDPRPEYFWLNGARIIAYDMPGWKIMAAGGYDRVPRAVQARIVREQAVRALGRLDEAMKFHPSSAALWIERANLQLNRLGDTAGAAASYRRAWEQPNAPYYAARLHAELLRRLGDKEAALAWLVQLHPQLPVDDEAAAAGLVLARIQTLERELGIPAAQAYQPAE